MPNSIEKVPYSIGYSFRNPRVVAEVTKVRPKFFHIAWAAEGPAQKKEKMYQTGVLQRFPTVWRRSAKAINIHKLGAAPSNRKELPDFNELGAAPGPTDKTGVADSTSRSVFGFLSNLITTAGGAIGQQQQLSMIKAQASAMGPTPTLPSAYTPTTDSGLGMLGWTAIIGGVGAVAYFAFKK